MCISAVDRPQAPGHRHETRDATGQQQRHLAFISEHTCDLRHTPGVENVVADALSRPREVPKKSSYLAITFER
jgi:hypothetical protein